MAGLITSSPTADLSVLAGPITARPAYLSLFFGGANHSSPPAYLTLFFCGPITARPTAYILSPCLEKILFKATVLATLFAFFIPKKFSA